MSSTDGEIRAVGADVDVPTLVGEIRADVERKLAAGEYPPEVLDDLESQPADDHDHATDDLPAALAELTRSSYFTARVTVDSKRPVIGRAVSRGRRIIRGSITWYMNGILQQVRNFAGNVDRSMAIVARRTNSLAARVAELEREVEELRGRLEQSDR